MIEHSITLSLAHYLHLSSILLFWVLTTIASNRFSLSWNIFDVVVVVGVEVDTGIHNLLALCIVTVDDVVVEALGHVNIEGCVAVGVCIYPYVFFLKWYKEFHETVRGRSYNITLIEKWSIWFSCIPKFLYMAWDILCDRMYFLQQDVSRMVT